MPKEGTCSGTHQIPSIFPFAVRTSPSWKPRPAPASPAAADHLLAATSPRCGNPEDVWWSAGSERPNGGDCAHRAEPVDVRARVLPIRATICLLQPHSDFLSPARRDHDARRALSPLQSQLTTSGPPFHRTPPHHPRARSIASQMVPDVPRLLCSLHEQPGEGCRHPRPQRHLHTRPADRISNRAASALRALV